MDLIESLPTSNGFTDILVIVDRLSKQAIFIPCDNHLTAPKLANYLFFMSSPNTVFLLMLRLIVARSSSPGSSGRSENSLT